ncbi:MAG: hypothetical protein D3923_01855, partial [Candidatus Electrothrix sp. AR3]|nr:hypothetical protein [Candidatus Electrothrix sp. AR3]
MPLLTRLGRKKLEQQQEEYLVKATHLLLEDNDLEGAAKILQQIKLSDEIEAHNRVLANNPLLMPFFALICAAIVSLLWICPQPRPRVHLDLETQTAVFRLAERKDFKWQETTGQNIDSILLDGLIEVEIPGLGLRGTTERLQAFGSKMSIRQIEISKGARLEIERSKDGVSLYIYEGTVEGIVELQESTLRAVLNGQVETHPISSMVPESLSFNSVNKGGGRLHLRLHLRDDWQIYGLQVTKMSFQRESAPNSQNFVSAILKGEIKLPETKYEHTLLEHDQLHLERAESTRLRLNFAPEDEESFHLLFQGRVCALAAGPDDFEQNLTPNLL